MLGELERLTDRGARTLVDEAEEIVSMLRAAQSVNELVSQGGPVLCEVAADAVVIQLAVPLFYPTQPLTVVEARRARESKAAPAVLRGMERELRRELSRLGEASEPLVLTALLRWIKEEAPQQLEALTREADAEREAARAAAAAKPAVVAEDVPDAREARLAEKYSPNWDLCTAFVKHGKCKNKNCKWRHEKPVVVEKPAPAEKQVADPKGPAGKK